MRDRSLYAFAVEEGPRLRTLLAMAAVLLAGMWLAPTSAEAAKLLMECAPKTDAAVPSVNCDIRTTTAYSPSKLVVSANGSVLTDSKFVPFRTSGETTAWLYLIDRSNPARAATVKRNVALAIRMVDRASSTMKIGVATFASDMQTVLPIASSHTGAVQKLQAIRADGVATEFFANAIKAIQMLDEVQADRKALVIISDGKAEDTAYSLSDVVKAAREADVTIMGLGYAERASETPELQSIRRIAEETDGLYREVKGAEELPTGFIDDLSRYIDNGGTVAANLPGLTGDVSIKIDATLQDNSTLSATQSVKIVAPSPADVKPTSLIGRIYAAFDPIVAGASRWANDNAGMAWLLLLLPLALIAALAGLWLSRRQVHVAAVAAPEGPVAWNEADGLDPIPLESGIDMANVGATRRFSPDATSPFGYFEIVGNEAKRYAVNTQSVSIGRHSDNDIQLLNDSVHRHHAHLRISPTGDAVIRDLDTKNGVIVNGSRVASKQLAPGDLVELGEVRMRYQVG
jgi:hypothetical protein